ncbi:MAG: hypothetical protein KY442_01245 [Proteobacteria bacterium]|nr:hypothetical protein [Pseudomonadota bacterium]
MSGRIAWTRFRWRLSLAGLLLGASSLALANGTWESAANRPGATAVEASGRASGFERVLSELRHIASASDHPFDLAEPAFPAWQAWLATNAALSDLDAALDAGMAADSGNAAPMVPSSCANASRPGCNACFRASYSRINLIRMRLERLHAVHGRTAEYLRARQWADRSPAPPHQAPQHRSAQHGSPQHGSVDPARIGIVRSRERLDRISQHKHRQLIGAMGEAIDNVSTCERVYFDNPDWAARHGRTYLRAIESMYRLDQG